MSTREPLDPLVFCAFLPVFAFFWLIVSAVIAEMSGWKAMASQCRAVRRPEGIRYLWRSMYLSSYGAYSACINVTLSSEGIFMVPSLPFRFRHPPLLIPWHRVGSLQRKRFIFQRCFLPIRAAETEWKLYVPCSAQRWMERHATQTA
jgi:hypothetical protein